MLPTPGIEVKDRGRVPVELVVEFKAATSQEDAQPGTILSVTTFTHMPPTGRSPAPANGLL